ncbi:hypothetical protein [Phreatobacter oligotrophus]|uniref:Uncharacterized protein n=1 Tax=Phreatobacter oligotrophus TaxID=1122261 RepID=A0A2T4ZGN4_9HYPH|nr:hypothetical protein [Phreatobacter oligotrophus]PTM61060.1 hypothetical protein C8P69_102446 [Phreatobacter oligotrophus]
MTIPRLAAALIALMALAAPTRADTASAVAACRAAPGAIRVAGPALCFTGDIDAGTAAQAMALLPTPGLTTLVIASDGGEVAAAVRLARAIRARGLILVVDDRCASSCANFLFPAARTKAVAERALLIFHGGIAPGAFGGLFGGGEERDLLALTRAFFREIGVDGAITYDAPYRRDPRSGVRELAEEWTATPAALARYGMTGIVQMWWPSNEAVLREAARRGMRLGIVE